MRRSEKRKREKKEVAGARKGRKVAIHYVYPMNFCSGGSESRLAKAAGAEPSGQMRDEKLHAVVARSTFPSENVKNTTYSDHFVDVQMSKKCTPVWREAHFQVKMCKTHQVVAVAVLRRFYYPNGLLILHDPAHSCLLFLPQQQVLQLSFLKAGAWLRAFPSTRLMLFTQPR